MMIIKLRIKRMKVFLYLWICCKVCALGDASLGLCSPAYVIGTSELRIT